VNGPLLVTERLELCLPRADDRAALFELTRSQAMHRFLGPDQSEAAQFARFARNAGSWWLYGYGSFVVRERGRHELVGSVGVFHSWRGFGTGLDDTPEAGWIVAEPHWGKGYAGEAIRAALAWFDALGAAPRVACMIAEANARSLALAARLGFTEYDRRVFDGDRVILLERLTGDAAGRPPR
jgi:RimJ/RimL family protein N-acetyltransferase